MTRQLSFLQNLFPCDETFNGVVHHGPARYIMHVTFYPNGKNHKGVLYPGEYLCEKCLKILTERRKNNDILDKMNDFNIKELK